MMGIEIEVKVSPKAWLECLETAAGKTELYDLLVLEAFKVLVLVIMYHSREKDSPCIDLD
jgi:hypothetical protein